MAARPGTLRVSARSIALAVAALGLTLLALRMVAGAERVLGWIAAATAAALLLTPPVEWLHRRRLPRGLAAALVAVGVLGGVGAASYGVGASLVRQYEALQEAAPRAASQLERSERFGEVAREAEVAEKVERFVDQIPERLRGGTAAEAVRSAATRGIAFLITAILSLFFLLHGPRLAAGFVRQLPRTVQDPARVIGGRAARRASGYALATLAEAVVAGLVGYALARALSVPGAAALGLWVALFDVVPFVGAALGALPIVLLAGAAEPWHGVVAFAAFLAYQVAEAVVVQPRLERRTIRLGPFLTVLAGAAGLEMYGLGGALGVTLALSFVVAVAAEWAALRDLPTGEATVVGASAHAADAWVDDES